MCCGGEAVEKVVVCSKWSSRRGNSVGGRRCVSSAAHGQSDGRGAGRRENVEAV